MPEKKIILTKEERTKLEKEYRNLIDVQLPEVIEQLQLARSQGDLSENADYDAAKDRQSQLEGRIQEIEQILYKSVAAEETRTGGAGKKIGIGDIVRFENLSTGAIVTIKIAGNIGADPMAEIPTVSNESPIGKALLGKKEGDEVTVESVEPYQARILPNED